MLPVSVLARAKMNVMRRQAPSSSSVSMIPLPWRFSGVDEIIGEAVAIPIARKAMMNFMMMEFDQSDCTELIRGIAIELIQAVAGSLLLKQLIRISTPISRRFIFHVFH
jgi:hypothetical protein